MQFFDKVVDVPVVALGTFVVAVQLLDKAADVPVAVPPRFRVLLCVKGVGDVLAGCWSVVLRSSSLESRASVTCLLGVGAGCCGALRWSQGRL